MKYKINELAKILDVSTNTIRRYEEMGYFKSYRDEESGYRYFDEESILKVINAKFLRKYGFSHDALCEMQNMDITDTVQSFEKQMYELDREIEYKKYLRHRLKDDIILMKKMQTDSFFRMENPEYLYVIYKENEKILKEKERLESLRYFIYDIPEIQRIMIMGKDTIEGKSTMIRSGWCVKTICVDRDVIKTKPYVEVYDSKPSLLGTVKLKIGQNKLEELFKSNPEEIRESLLGRHLEYMKNNGLRSAGEAIFMVVASAKEENEDIIYLWGSIPVEPII